MRRTIERSSTPAEVIPRLSRRAAPFWRRGRRVGAPRAREGAIFLLAAASIPFMGVPPASAGFERIALTAISSAAGGAAVSAAEGAGAIFLNPAGCASIEGLETYADYAEPCGMARAREMRLAIAGNTGPARCVLGWYRLDGEYGAEDFISAGASRTVVAGTQGSYIAIGAAAVAGRPAGGAWTPASADVGVVVRPLPVISFGYAAGNLLDRGEDADGLSRWGRTQRWGISYYWEDMIVLSLGRSVGAGGTKQHFGISARATVPVEISFGLRDGDAAGGLRWIGSRMRTGVSFAVEEGAGVTWMVSCEGAIFASRENER